MRRALRIALAAVLGAVAGAAGTLAFPLEDAPRVKPGRPEPPAIVGEAPIPTLLVWTPGSLPLGYPDSVARLPRVRAAAVVRSGTAWLEGWRGPGRALEGRADGLAVPMEAAAIDPQPYLAFVPPADRPVVSGLADGGALLSRSAAMLRDVGEGGMLRFAGATLQIEGVVDDELVGAHEVVVSTEIGARLGIHRPRYLLVAPRRGAARGPVERSLRRALPGGVRARIRGPGETPVFRHGDAVLPPLRLKELFGEFAAAPAAGGTLSIDPAWTETHIRAARVPVLGRVRCHRAVVPRLRAALEEIVRRGLDDLLDPGDYGGCWSPRFINRSPDAGISHHAWGIAFDVNVAQNGLGSEPRLDRRVVEIFERHGFTWGGRWLVPDGMHFELLGFPH